MVPQTLVLRMALRRASRLLDVSSVRSAYLPCVRSLIAATGSLEPGLTSLVGAELPGALQPLRVDVERDHPRAHRLGELGAGQADRPLAEDGDRVAAGDVHAPQRAIGGAGAAGDRGARREAQLLGQRHHRVGRHLAGTWHARRARCCRRPSPAPPGRAAASRSGNGCTGCSPGSDAPSCGRRPWPRRAATPGPTATTTPQGSCPAMTGSGWPACRWPARGWFFGRRYWCRSDPHMPEAFISSTTSPGPGVGSGKS